MITPKSWWVNRRSGQRLAVAFDGAYRERIARAGIRHWKHVAYGRNDDRIPCHLEGEGLFLAWLTEDELRGGWKPLRGLKKDPTFVPSWIRMAEHNDFSFIGPAGEPLWVGVHRISASGWMCLYGIAIVKGPEGLPAKHVVDDHGRFDWGIQRWNTFFMPVSEAIPKLAPRFSDLRPTIWDHLMS